MQRKVLILVLLLVTIVFAQEPKQGPIEIVSGVLFAKPFVQNSNATHLETSVRGVLVLKNNQVGKIENIKISTFFFDFFNKLHYGEDLKVDSIRSKSEAEVNLFWANPSNVPVQRVEGVVSYLIDGETYEIPFRVINTTNVRSPVETYDTSR